MPTLGAIFIVKDLEMMKWNLPSIIHLRDSKVSWRVSNNNFSDQIYHRVVLGLTVVYAQITLLWRYFTLEITLGSRGQF